MLICTGAHCTVQNSILLYLTLSPGFNRLPLSPNTHMKTMNEWSGWESGRTGEKMWVVFLFLFKNVGIHQRSSYCAENRTDIRQVFVFSHASGPFGLENLNDQWVDCHDSYWLWKSLPFSSCTTSMSKISLIQWNISTSRWIGTEILYRQLCFPADVS